MTTKTITSSHSDANLSPRSSHSSTCNQKRWQSSLQLQFDHAHGKTRLSKRKHQGALLVQRALYPEHAHPDICHVYVLYPPAGIAYGDQLSMDIRLSEHTHALLTTPGAGKWYGTAAGQSAFAEADSSQPAEQHITLTVADNACVEWLPQESIVFNHAQVQAKTDIYLSVSASLMAWEITVFGRRAFMERFLQGNYRNEISIYQYDTEQHDTEGRCLLILHDLLDVAAASRWFTSPLGLHDQHVLGSFWVMPPVDVRDQLSEEVEALRDLISEDALPLYVTQIGALVIVRYLGAEVRACFGAMDTVRLWLRERWFGCEQHSPRIWDT